jgi:hypothetical protein
MTAQQTPAQTSQPLSSAEAQAAFDQADAAHAAAIAAFDGEPTAAWREAVVTAAEDSILAHGRLKLAQKREADAAAAKAAADRKAKLDELAKLNAANTIDAARASVEPEVAELHAIAKRLVAIRASLKTKRGAFHAGHEEGKRIAAALGLHTTAPPNDQNTFRGLARGAAEEAVSPPFRAAGLSVRVLLDELDI